jgi:ABC-type sugar transport system ATPase subunit
VKVGLVTKTDTNPFFVKLRESAQKEADAPGVDLIALAGKFDGDNEGQVAAIENLVARGVQGILIIPSGIETVYQDLAVAPALDIATNLFLGRELRRAGPTGRVFRLLDRKRMRTEAARHLADPQIGITSITQPVETLSGGQRQGVAVARAAAFARKLVILDEPTAALGVKEPAWSST